MSAAGANEQMKVLQLPHGTSISMAIWEVLVKAIKASASVGDGRLLPLDPKFPA